RGRLALFFGAYATVSVLKVYGAPGINWLGALPILDRAIFPKYNQPVVAFCIAGLAALAVDRLARQPSYAPSVKRVVWTALATMSTIAFFVAYHWSFLTGKGSAVRWMAQQLAMTVVVMALFVVAAVRTRRTPRSAAALFGLLLAELIFFVPRN